mgnify:CR=1 FL=1
MAVSDNRKKEPSKLFKLNFARITAKTGCPSQLDNLFSCFVHRFKVPKRRTFQLLAKTEMRKLQGRQIFFEDPV